MFFVLRVKLALLVLLTDCLLFSGVRDCFEYAEGLACWLGKAMCHLCGGRNYSRHYCFSKVFVNASHFIFLCSGVFYFFLGRIVSRQVVLCQDTAKLSAELR